MALPISLTRLAWMVPFTRPPMVSSSATISPSTCAPSSIRTVEAWSSPSMRPEILTVPLPLILPTIVMLELIEETSRPRLASVVTAGQVKELDGVSGGCPSVFQTCRTCILSTRQEYDNLRANQRHHFAAPCGRGIITPSMAPCTRCRAYVIGESGTLLWRLAFSTKNRRRRRRSEVATIVDNPNPARRLGMVPHH